MASQVSTTTEGMRKASGLFENASSTLTGQLQTVNNEWLALQASWQGQTSEKFNHAMDAWEQNFAAVIHQLDEMIEIMGGNAKLYEAAEEEAESIAPTFDSWADGLAI